MLYAAITCFAIAILFGITMLTFVLRDKKIPKILPLIHGPFALAGLGLLITYASYTNTMLAVIILFSAAALGGLTLFFKDKTGKPIPKAMAVGHGFIALVTFVILLIITFAV